MKDKQVKRPLISIVTPCFNSYQTIERTILSVLNQKFDNYEYIVVDGGSTDGTIEIIKKYEPLFNGRMKWKSEPDQGIYDAFTKGAKRSVGWYVWIVNSDDYIEEEALSYFASHIMKYLPDNEPVITAYTYFRGANGELLTICKSSPEKVAFAFRRNGMGLIHPSTIVPKSVYEQVGYYFSGFKIKGDVDWFLRMYEKGISIVFLDKVVTNMRDGGVSNQAEYKKMLRDELLLLSRRYSNKLMRMFYLIYWHYGYMRYKLNLRKIRNGRCR